jgi:hypothetical protein
MQPNRKLVYNLSEECKYAPNSLYTKLYMQKAHFEMIGKVL